MANICEFKVPRQKLLECPSCTEFFFERINQVEFDTPITIVVIRRYLLRKCFLGLGVSNHVYSLILLPGEETEIEIVRRSKYSRALHEQRSVESEFRFEMQNTARDEWSREEKSNFQISGSAGFKIFGIGSKVKSSYSRRTKTAERHFREVINKSVSQTSQKYEVAIDTKTEVENQYRSIRKVTNPNACQPVIYNYSQLAKLYKTELILTDLRFDFLPTPPTILTSPKSTFEIVAETPYPQNLNLQVVASPPAWTLTEIAVAPTPVLSQVTPLPAFRETAVRTANIAGLPKVDSSIQPPDVTELTKEELLEKLRESNSFDDKTLAQFESEFKDFLNEDVNKLEVKDTYEYCINTDSLFVEANISECSACDEATIELRELEVKKTKVEIELLKRKLEEEDCEEND
ncbi:MAG: hypothetical protein O7G31_11185 [Calditrichaeota bacterium]|nr:hypothetical protein [Calditrichota bacterium]